MSEPGTVRTARLVVVSAGLGDPSSSRLLAGQLARAAAAQLAHVDVHASVELIELGGHAHDLMTRLVTGFTAPPLQAALDTVVGADGLVLVTPIYTAGISGLFKTFLDVLEPDSLVGMPVLLGATGGSERHSLAIDYAVRPALTYLRTAPVPTAVFAATSDWGTAGESALARRVDRAAGELAELVAATAGTRAVDDPFALPAGFDPSGRQGGLTAVRTGSA